MKVCKEFKTLAITGFFGLLRFVLKCMRNLFFGGFAYIRLISDTYIGAGQLFVIFFSS